jgi:hypothetical protein
MRFVSTVAAFLVSFGRRHARLREVAEELAEDPVRAVRGEREPDGLALDGPAQEHAQPEQLQVALLELEEQDLARPPASPAGRGSSRAGSTSSASR